MPVENVPLQEVVDRRYVVAGAQNGKSKTVLSLERREVLCLGVLLRFCTRRPFIYVDRDELPSRALVCFFQPLQRLHAIVRFARPEVKQGWLAAKRGERPLFSAQIWKRELRGWDRRQEPRLNRGRHRISYRPAGCACRQRRRISERLQSQGLFSFLHPNPVIDGKVR